jgi:protein CpxP
MGMMGGPGALPMLAARLDLTDAQRDTVRRIMDAHRDELTALGDRGFAARRAVHAAIIAESVDEAAVRARSADLAVVEADTAVAHARIHAEIWQILTPDQQAQARKLQEEIASRQEQMRERRQQHAGEPGRRRGR